MCTNPSPNLFDLIDSTKLSLTRMLFNCDSFSPKKSNSPNVPFIQDNIVSYLAWSNSETYRYEACRQAMVDRLGPDNLTLYGWKNYEQFMYLRRFKLMSSNNRAYALAVKLSPTIQDLEEYSTLDPCFAILSSILKYLIDHPTLAKEYTGLLPFGREVIKCFNAMVKTDWKVKGSPSYKDHIRLQEMSNDKAILMGIPTITFNSLMYQIGRQINPSDNSVSDED